MEVEIIVEKELIAKLADDVWSMAKRLESIDDYSDVIYETIKDLKTMSGCLHDLRAEHNTKWYEDKKF